MAIFFQALYEALQTNIPCFAEDFEPCGVTLKKFWAIYVFRDLF
jgi:hypothetical protein